MSTQHSIGHPFIELLTVDSTNNYAMGLVHAGMAQHGTAVFAHHQLKGRGQRGKAWISERDHNVALSVLIDPAPLAPSELFYLSMAVAVATARLLNQYLANEVCIKWPNDLYWRDRKAGGILIENVLQGADWKFAVAGIGLNINQTSFEGLERKAVSLKQITGRHMDPLQLARELCQHLEAALNDLSADKAAIAASYNQQLYQLNRWVRLKKDSRVFDAEVKGVSNNGDLVVHHATEERFAVGEVEWLGL